MKTSKTINLLLVIGLFLGLSLNSQILAQGQYKLNGKPELKVMGGSTIHDWTMVSVLSQGNAEMIVEGTTVKNVKSANVTMKTESLKSGKGKMDEIAYETLKTKKHPTIQFTLTSFKIVDSKKAKATGNLTIAGTTKPVCFNTVITVKGESVFLTGETDIKFSDFNITPPTAMLGTIKTSNDLKLLFKVNLQQAAIQ